MKLLADKDVRFRNLVGKTAVFLLLAAVGIALTFVVAGVRKGMFTPKSAIYLVTDSGQDLAEGMPVKFSGFKIGSVRSLALEQTGRVKVEVAIEQKYLHLLKEDAVARLKKEGLIGDVALEISGGSPGARALAAKGTLRLERTAGLEQVAVDVRERLLPILADLQQMLHDPNGDVRQTLKNLREFSVEMRATRARLDRLLDHADASVTTEVRPMLRSLRQTSAHAENMAAQLEQSLPGLVLKADNTLDNLQQTSTTIRNAVAQTAPELPGLIGDTHDIVRGVGSSWPVKNMLPAPESGPVRMDSHD